MSHVASIESLKELTRLQQTHAITVVDFYATWCGPCMSIKKPYAALAKTYPASNCALVQCNVEDGEELAAKFRVTALPTFIIFSGDTKVRCIQGADLAAVESAVKGLLTKRPAANVTVPPADPTAVRAKKSKKGSKKQTAEAPKKQKKQKQRATS